jgi:MoxR-like ATPase
MLAHFAPMGALAHVLVSMAAFDERLHLVHFMPVMALLPLRAFNEARAALYAGCLLFIMSWQHQTLLRCAGLLAVVLAYKGYVLGTPRLYIGAVLCLHLVMGAYGHTQANYVLGAAAPWMLGVSGALLVGLAALFRMPSDRRGGSMTALESVRACLGKVIRGKPEAIERVLITVLAGGHILLEDVPGVGKTTLAKTLARALGLSFSRVQFTPDLLPTDILGMNVLDPRDGSFTFHSGPIFTQLLLADEINRASPRTQSALLEAMNEGQVTLENKTRPLPEPFLVIATQNPVDYQGTYPLPEAQLDRFLLRISLGYPDESDELEVLFDRQTEDPLTRVEQAIDSAGLLALQRQVRTVTVTRDVGKYLLSVVRATRAHPDLEMGASPRAGLALFRACQARALLLGRDWVGPDDVQQLARPVLEHRVVLSSSARYGRNSAASVITDSLSSVRVPL